MAMNSASVANAVRLLSNGGASLARNGSQLKEYLRENGVRTVYIRSAGKPASAVRAAEQLNGVSKVVIECNASDFRALSKSVARDQNIDLLPCFDIKDSVSELKKITSMLRGRKGTSYILIQNEDKIVDKKRIQKAMTAIMKEIGQKDVKFHWDCGFALCSFSGDELGYFIQKGSDVQCSCPSSVHVDSELKLHICGKLKGKIGSASIVPGVSLFSTIQQIRSALMPFGSFGIFQQCGECRHFPVVCSGGCKATVMRSFR